MALLTRLVGAGLGLIPNAVSSLVNNTVAKPGAIIGQKLSQPATKEKIASSADSLSSAINSNISNLLEAYSTSAIKAERESVASQQKFNAEQAELAWRRSQSSAEKQMKFQADQADLAWRRSETSAQKQMDFQKEQAQIQRDYETEMSNTAYQRVVADLKKAGINPLLAVTQGGATTPNAVVPSGSSASAQAMGGASASASSASANKGDYTSAKKADLSFLLGDMFDGIFSSAGKVMSMFARLSAMK